MDTLEKAALDEIVRTVAYIAEKVDKLEAKVSDLQNLEHREDEA